MSDTQCLTIGELVECLQQQDPDKLIRAELITGDREEGAKQITGERFEVVDFVGFPLSGDLTIIVNLTEGAAKMLRPRYENANVEDCEEALEAVEDRLEEVIHEEENEEEI